jgi:hypothetical protein
MRQVRESACYDSDTRVIVVAGLAALASYFFWRMKKINSP